MKLERDFDGGRHTGVLPCQVRALLIKRNRGLDLN